MSYLKRKMTSEDFQTIHKNLASRLLKLRSDPSCDFCGCPTPTWMYAAMRMSTGERRENWRWCACDVCQTAIDSDNWDIIKFRIVEWLQKQVPEKPISELLLATTIALGTFKQNAIKLGE